MMRTIIILTDQIADHMTVGIVILVEEATVEAVLVVLVEIETGVETGLDTVGVEEDEAAGDQEVVIIVDTVEAAAVVIVAVGVEAGAVVVAEVMEKARVVAMTRKEKCLQQNQWTGLEAGVAAGAGVVVIAGVAFQCQKAMAKRNEMGRIVIEAGVEVEAVVVEKGGNEAKAVAAEKNLQSDTTGAEVGITVQA